MLEVLESVKEDLKDLIHMIGCKQAEESADEADEVEQEEIEMVDEEEAVGAIEKDDEKPRIADEEKPLVTELKSTKELNKADEDKILVETELAEPSIKRSKRIRERGKNHAKTIPKFIVSCGIWEAGKTYYCVTKGAAYPALRRRSKPRRGNHYFSSLIIRPGESRKGDGVPLSFEVVVLQCEDMEIPREVAKVGVCHERWGTVTKLHDDFIAYQRARKQSTKLWRCLLMATITTKISFDDFSPEFVSSPESFRCGLSPSEFRFSLGRWSWPAQRRLSRVGSVRLRLTKGVWLRKRKTPELDCPRRGVSSDLLCSPELKRLWMAGWEIVYADCTVGSWREVAKWRAWQRIVGEVEKWRAWRRIVRVEMESRCHVGDKGCQRAKPLIFRIKNLIFRIKTYLAVPLENSYWILLLTFSYLWVFSYCWASPKHLKNKCLELYLSSMDRLGSPHILIAGTSTLLGSNSFQHRLITNNCGLDFFNRLEGKSSFGPGCIDTIPDMVKKGGN